jgi:hypothetical protein
MLDFITIVFVLLLVTFMVVLGSIIGLIIWIIKKVFGV